MYTNKNSSATAPFFRYRLSDGCMDSAFRVANIFQKSYTYSKQDNCAGVLICPNPSGSERGDSMDLVKKWSKRVKRMKKIKKAIRSIKKNARKIASCMDVIYKAIRNKP